MEDNEKVYLDKVVEFLVRDTIIDYEGKEIKFPFSLSSSFSSFYVLPSFSYFKKYCKDTYGLIDREIEYVWGEYKKIIVGKIKNY